MPNKWDLAVAVTWPMLEESRELFHGANLKIKAAKTNRVKRRRSARPSKPVRARVQGRGVCQNCQATFASLTARGIRLEIDHIKPVTQGGRGNIENLQLLCRPCHTEKGARNLTAPWGTLVESAA